MISTASILTATELCRRRGVWTRQGYELEAMLPIEMLRYAVEIGLTTEEETDYGELAEEETIYAGANRGMTTNVASVYETVKHHACLANIITSYLRKPGEPSWDLPSPVSTDNLTWESEAFLDESGGHLRRIIFASYWSDDRNLAEYRSWRSIGEVCAYGIPMQEIVILLGRNQNGKRHSAWTKGLLHPQSKQLRFRKRTSKQTTSFNANWKEVWREHRDEIDREAWLKAMESDDMLRELVFSVEVKLPSEPIRQKILDMAKRKIEELESIKALPEAQLSTCDEPEPCPFQGCCWENPEKRPEDGGYVLTQTQT